MDLAMLFLFHSDCAVCWKTGQPLQGILGGGRPLVLGVQNCTTSWRGPDSGSGHNRTRGKEGRHLSRAELGKEKLNTESGSDGHRTVQLSEGQMSGLVWWLSGRWGKWVAPFRAWGVHAARVGTVRLHGEDTRRPGTGEAEQEGPLPPPPRLLSLGGTSCVLPPNLGSAGLEVPVPRGRARLGGSKTESLYTVSYRLCRSTLGSCFQQARNDPRKRGELLCRAHREEPNMGQMGPASTVRGSWGRPRPCGGCSVAQCFPRQHPHPSPSSARPGLQQTPSSGMPATICLQGPPRVVTMVLTSCLRVVIF